MRALRLAALAAVVSGAGCFGNLAGNRAALIAARQHDCPRDRVSVISDAGNWTYWLNVCGRRRLYSTRDGNYVDITDSVGGGGPSGGRHSTFDDGSEVVTREAWREDDFERLRRMVDAEVRACFPASYDERVVVTVTISTRGHVTAATVASGVTTLERTCVTEAFLGVRISGRARAAGFTEIAFDFTPPEPAPPVAATTPVVDPTVEAAARAVITSHAPAIVACLGGASALDVSIATDGRVTIAARGALAGSAEEACARAALGDAVIVPAPASPATILHAVAP